MHASTNKGHSKVWTLSQFSLLRHLSLPEAPVLSFQHHTQRSDLISMTKTSKKNHAKGRPSSANLPEAGSSPAVTLLKRKRSGSTDRQSSVGQFQTPPTSPATPEVELPSMIRPVPTAIADAATQAIIAPQEQIDGPIFTADEIACSNQDIVAMADMFATMKKALLSMTGNLERLGTQSERIVSFAVDIKAADQVCHCFLSRLWEFDL